MRSDSSSHAALSDEREGRGDSSTSSGGGSTLRRWLPWPVRRTGIARCDGGGGVDDDEEAAVAAAAAAAAATPAEGSGGAATGGATDNSTGSGASCSGSGGGGAGGGVAEDPIGSSGSSNMFAGLLSMATAKATSIHPGQALLVTSLPLLFAARRAYRKPLDPVVQRVLSRRRDGIDHHHQHQTTAAVSSADLLQQAGDDVRRAVGSAVALRALKVSTLGSFGGFCLAGSLFFYAGGYDDVGDAVERTRDWAHEKRRYLDSALGLSPDHRVDRDHPEALAVRGMTHEEELRYVSENYLPQDEKWDDDDENHGDENSSPDAPS